MVDCLIVGGGPAGMSAALYALRNGKSALIIEKNGFGGQITYSPKVENIPGFLSVSGNEFADHFIEQVLAQGAEVELACVTKVTYQKDHFQVVTEEGGLFEARTVILATGVKHRMLGLPGEEELVGDGISFCAVCDGDFYANQEVIVAGGGNSALQEALLLSGKCSKVTVLQDLPYFTGEKKLQDLLFERPNVTSKTNVRITGLEKRTDGSFCGVRVQDRNSQEESVISADGLFVAIGLIPENGAFVDLADLNDYGYFDSDERCLTRSPGLFVAGDCRSKRIRQVTTACADGAIAALAACSYLDQT